MKNFELVGVGVRYEISDVVCYHYFVEVKGKNFQNEGLPRDVCKTKRPDIIFFPYSES